MALLGTRSLNGSPHGESGVRCPPLAVGRDARSGELPRRPAVRRSLSDRQHAAYCVAVPAGTKVVDLPRAVSPCGVVTVVLPHRQQSPLVDDLRMTDETGYQTKK